MFLCIGVPPPTALPHHLFPKSFSCCHNQYRESHCDAPAALSWIWTVPCEDVPSFKMLIHQSCCAAGNTGWPTKTGWAYLVLLAWKHWFGLFAYSDRIVTKHLTLICLHLPLLTDGATTVSRFRNFKEEMKHQRIWPDQPHLHTKLFWPPFFKSVLKVYFQLHQNCWESGKRILIW